MVKAISALSAPVSFMLSIEALVTSAVATAPGTYLESTFATAPPKG